MLLNLREIDYVLAIAEYKNVSRAAESLFISQPALSRFILNLEGQLGVDLFNRQGNRIELSAAGRQYILRAREIALQRDMMISEMKELADVRTKSLVIGAMPYSGKNLLPEALSKLRRKYPDLSVKLVERHCRDLEQMLLKSTIDVGILGVPTINPDICDEWLADEYVLLAISRDNPVVKEGVHVDGLPFPWIDVQKLKGENFVATEKLMRSRMALDALFEQENIAPPIAYTTGNSMTALEFAKRGLGICLTFDFSFGPYLNTKARGKLDLFCVGTPIKQMGVGFGYLKHETLTQPAQHFIKIYRELHTHYCSDITDSLHRD